MLILGRRDVRAVLDGADDAVCCVVREAYLAHAVGDTAVPHSVFLRFPDAHRNRIIALPAYVGGGRPVAGVKWIASFPDNTARGGERASATIVLNSLDDGRPVAVLEGALISARRTAASAALAAAALLADAPAAARAGVALVGCGVINREVLRLLRGRLPELAQVTAYDIDPDRADAFAAAAAADGLDSRVASTVDDALAAHRLVSLATTATEPHLDTTACRPGSVLLHLSLRDLRPQSVLAARNVVDDTEHVLRAGTSLELAERLAGHRDFVHAEIGDLLGGRRQLVYRDDAITVFSPFGLGVLDAAVAAYALDEAEARGLGTRIADFATDVVVTAR